MFQAICASCHLDKSTQEGSQTKLLESRFSKRAWNEYAVTPRPPPLAWQAHTYAEDISAHLFEIDIRRSRMNALTNSAHEFSVFCVFDNILSSKVGELADFSLCRSKQANALNLLCYRMSGQCGTIAWQSNTCCATQFRLGTISYLVSPAPASCQQTASGLQLKPWILPGRIRRLPNTVLTA